MPNSKLSVINIPVKNETTGEIANQNFDLKDPNITPPDVSGKADKVSGATNGNFAGLDGNGNLTDSGKKAGDFAASSHNQASNTINAMTGYSKPSSTSAIGTSDSLNAAMGKLEKGIETPISDADWSTLSTLFS